MLLFIIIIHISGPSTVQNQNLWSAYMYIYCHAEVSNLPISADRASRNFVENSAISRNRVHLPNFGNISAMIEISRCLFRAAFNIVAARGAFKIVACFLHNGYSKVCLPLTKKKLTIIYYSTIVVSIVPWFFSIVNQSSIVFGIVP